MVSQVEQLQISDPTETEFEVILNPGEETREDLELPTTITILGKEYTITWTSDDEEVISNTGVVVRPEVGQDDAVVKLTAVVKDADDVEIATVEFNVNVPAETGVPEHTAVASYSGGSTTNMTDGNNAALIGLDENIFTVTAHKQSASNNVGLNKAGQIRFYANSQSGDGNILEIEIDSQYSITSVEFEFGASTNNPTGKLMLDDVEHQLVTNDLRNTTLNYNDLNISKFSLQNTQTGGSSAQIWILSITITYVPVN